MVPLRSQIQSKVDAPADKLSTLLQLAGPCHQKHVHLPWGFRDNAFAAAGEAEYHAEMVQAVANILCAEVSQRGYFLLPEDPSTTFYLLSPISAVVLQQISNLEASNSHRSFLSMGKLSKFLLQTLLHPANVSNSFVLSLMGVSRLRNL